jgi:acyl-CoA synthetase (AMP-forming)/AMP-acid ligase II
VLGELIGQAAARFGDRPAYVGESGLTLTFADLDRLSDEVAAGFAARGVGEGDVVAVALPTIPEYPVVYLAAAKLGAITAGVNTRLSPDEQAAVLAVAGPRLVVSSDLVEAAAHPDDALRGLRDAGRIDAPVATDPERPVAIVFTSGTTGTPKGALFANRQLAAITAIDVGDRWDGGGTSLAGTSLAHLGFMTKFAGNLRLGSTTHMVGRWRADDALRFTAEHRLSTVAGIPTQVALMLRVPDFDDHDLSSVKAIVIGGGPATPSLVREARARFDAPLAVRYSCTEAAIGVGTSFTDPPEDAEETVGRPLAGVELAILDADDEPVPTGEIGAVCLRSAAVMSGYWGDPAATTGAFTADGFVRTGDLGRLDERGRLHLAGRTKEMYVRGGYNVFPLEVEAVLSSHPSVAAVAVVPTADPVMGEKGVAVVVPADPAAPPSLEDLRRHAAARLARHKLPEVIRIVDELPLTAMEKLDRRRLVEMIADTRVR